MFDAFELVIGGTKGAVEKKEGVVSFTLTTEFGIRIGGVEDEREDEEVFVE